MAIESASGNEVGGPVVYQAYSRAVSAPPPTHNSSSPITSRDTSNNWKWTIGDLSTRYEVRNLHINAGLSPYPSTYGASVLYLLPQDLHFGDWSGQ